MYDYICLEGDINPGNNARAANNVRAANNLFTKPRLMPNPTNHQFELIMPGEFEYRLFDLLGKTLQQGRSANSLLFGGNLKPGIYLLHVITGGKTYAEKLFKL